MQRLLVASLVLFLSLTLMACGDVIDSILDPVESVELHDEALEAVYYIDAFDIGVLSLRVRREGEEDTFVEVDESMLTRIDRNKLQRAGTHEITIRYHGERIPFTVTLIDREVLHDDTVVYETFDKWSIRHSYFYTLVRYYDSEGIRVATEVRGFIETSEGLIDIALVLNAAYELQDIVIINSDYTHQELSFLEETFLPFLIDQPIDQITFYEDDTETYQFESLTRLLEMTEDLIVQIFIQGGYELFGAFYETERTVFHHGILSSETVYKDSEGNILGYHYQFHLVDNDFTFPFVVFVEEDRFLTMQHVYMSFETPSISAEIAEVISLMSDYAPSTLDAMQHFSYPGISSQMLQILTEIKMRLEEDETLRSIRHIFFEANQRDEIEVLEGEPMFIHKQRYYYEETLVGTVYRVYDYGYNSSSPIIIDVAIDTSGMIVYMAIVEHFESVYGASFNVLEDYLFTTSVNRDETFYDTYAGATQTADALARMLEAVFERHALGE